MTGDDETLGVAPDPVVVEATTDALLELQRIESVLVRAELEHPDAAAPEEVRRLRYLLRFAHLTEFQPGAANAHRRVKGRPEVSLGSEELTAGLRAVDAAGFSAAIPGVLHYDVLDPDPTSGLALDSLFEREGLAALVDGGVIANVPAALTWNRLQTGRLGTRNTFMLAFDCFHPQWDPKHLWLQPIAQAVALQHTRDVRYVDWMIRFEPTLSPVTIVPGPEAIDLAIQWGRASVEPLLPMIERSLEPVWWDVAPARGQIDGDRCGAKPTPSTKRYRFGCS